MVFGFGGLLLVVELEVHAVVDFVVLQSDVIFEDGVPLLQHDFVPPEITNEISKTFNKP